MNRINHKTTNTRPCLSLLTAAVGLSAAMLSGCDSSSSSDSNALGIEPRVFEVVLGNDLNRGNNPLFSANPGGPGTVPNQSQRAGDVLEGGPEDEVMVGGLGVDILIGGDGDDILIGGTEDFGGSVDGDGFDADNRDRAFGQGGNDVFLWAPGDGSDYFNGGDGIDVVVFGIIGEERDADGSTEGAPFFNVNPSGPGSEDFDGVFLDEYGQPFVQVSSGPGFCSVVDHAVHGDELDLLGLDHLVRFSIRGIADAFDEGSRSDDDGLRVALSLKNTEFLVCTERDLDPEGEPLNNIQVLDISGETPVVVELGDLPEYVQNLVL